MTGRPVESVSQQTAGELETWRNLAVHGTCEEALDALEVVVQRLDDGNLPLDLTVECYEVGASLAKRCQQLLDDAELRISRVEILDDAFAEE